MDARTLLASAARLRPRGTAAFCGPRRLTYPDLLGQAARLADDLESAGARPGDRVAALFANCHLYLACYAAALERGLVLLPINLKQSPSETRAILDYEITGRGDDLRVDVVSSLLPEEIADLKNCNQGLSS